MKRPNEFPDREDDARQHKPSVAKEEKPLSAPTLGAAALGELVPIAVGSEEKKKIYHVYKDIICYHSEYFRAAYNGKWKESDEGVSLEDVEPEVVNIFIHWLYTQQLPDNYEELFRITGAKIEYDDDKPDNSVATGIEADNGHAKDDETKDDRTDRDIEWSVTEDLIKACIFGDRFMCPGFKQAAHNSFVDLQGARAPFYDHVCFAFDNLEDDDPLLQFLVDLQCLCWKPDDDDDEEVKLRARIPRSFMWRVMERNIYLNKSRSFEHTHEGMSVSLCHYHIHSSENERKGCPAYVDPRVKKAYIAQTRRNGMH